MNFEVNAGKFEPDGERNYKYCSDFPTMKEAVDDFNEKKLWQYDFFEIVGTDDNDDYHELFTWEDIQQWEAGYERVTAIGGLQEIELMLTGQKYCSCRPIEEQIVDIKQKIERLILQRDFFKNQAEGNQFAADHWHGVVNQMKSLMKGV